MALSPGTRLGAYSVTAKIGEGGMGEVYRAQGKYTEAEPLYQRALTIWEKALGPEHPDVATMLENYARMLRVLNRHDEAEMMEARAKAIRAKHAEENPPK